jgi:hypothetical protein
MSVHYSLFEDGEDRSSFTVITKPHELTLEEKDQLIFALLEHLKLSIYRANFDKSYSVLAQQPEE